LATLPDGAEVEGGIDAPPWSPLAAVTTEDSANDSTGAFGDEPEQATV
jgi:hypothetical protein